jgi:NDP-sugar pyrophosphorylase family protein
MPARALTVVLAAGEGKRMHSILPKVLHRVGGRPLVEHLVQASLKAGLGPVIVVVGHRRDMVIEALVDYPIDVVVQDDQRGTGHAMQMVREHLGNYEGACLVVPGDAPFLRPATMRELAEFNEEGHFAASLLTAVAPDPSGYGRIIRSAAGDVERIVEDGDATHEERDIHEINSGVYVFDYRRLTQALDELRANNSQSELYLTDTIATLRAAGQKIGAKQVTDPIEVSGVNDPTQLREADRIYRERQPPAPPPPRRPQVDFADEETMEEEPLGRSLLGTEEESVPKDPDDEEDIDEEIASEDDEEDDLATIDEPEDDAGHETRSLADIDTDPEHLDEGATEPAPSTVKTPGIEP